jgi:hypothetical protein
MRITRFVFVLVPVVVLGCAPRQETSAAASDTSLDRGDSSRLRLPSPSDTQNGARPTDTLSRPRPMGMQRPDGPTRPIDRARRDSASQQKGSP